MKMKEKKQSNPSGNGEPATNGTGKRPVINIREMTIEDLAPVFHLGEKVFTADYSLNLYRTWDEYQVLSIFMEDSDFCIVAEIEKRLVGFVLGTTIAKRRSSWNYGYLLWLGVDPDFQKMRVAERLFKHFRNLMIEEGVRMLLVDTEADNEAALKFFGKMGFTNPREHVYLSLNLAIERKSSKK